MFTCTLRIALRLLAAVCCVGVSGAAFGAEEGEGGAAAGRLLWEIGVADNNNAEFALAPANHEQYRRDGFFVVGRSESARDWPYVQPGPADQQFGGRQHTFTILFGLKTGVPDGQCRLKVDLINTHASKPPELEIALNGSTLKQQMPPGADDAALLGEPVKGKEHLFDVVFPANLLRPGKNEIRITTVSGSMILYDWLGFEAPASAAIEPLGMTFLEPCKATPHLLVRDHDALCHPVSAEVHHFGPPIDLSVLVPGRAPSTQMIDTETARVEFTLPACESEASVPVTFRTPEGVVAEQMVPLAPARRLELYLLPHSHVDIGYTKIQTEVERDHWRYIEQGIDTARQTATFPPEARFKWNAEVLWAVDSYLRQARPEKRAAFAEAVTNGWIGLDAFYCHELAGLCRPEELVRLLDCARRMKHDYGAPIEAAMVTDCPGLTWGAITVLAQSGVKYLSLGPNSGHRTGYARDAWDNRPFYWVSPCGRHKVLCWQTDTAYGGAFHSEPELRDFLEAFDRNRARHPYDILYFRQCRGDNAGPDTELPAFVKEWNERFAYPCLIIATTAELFRAFEKRYGDGIPSARGDFSPYWEDGAASSARETALNRAAAERLVQAETLWTLLNPSPFPHEVFGEAWRNVLLYNEHTWGARSYVGHAGAYPPGSPEYDAQWAIKQAFAVDADAQSRRLLATATDQRRCDSKRIAAVDVFNTASWPRSDLIVLPKGFRVRGESVRDADGNELPVQRLASGELAVFVKNVPAFGAKRLIFRKGRGHSSGAARAHGGTLSNGLVTVTVDEATGAIRQLRCETLGIDLADTGSDGLNSYWYVEGFDPNGAVSSGPVTITVSDCGPLVASLRMESDAPGCKRLVREVRIADSLGRVDLINTVDKKPIPLADLLKAQPQKEGYHFGFAFNVPDGVMRVDMPWAVVRPEADQLPGSCKNWLSAQRWADVSNQDMGVTWATVDAPLIEPGVMSAQPVDPFSKDVWKTAIEPSQRFYSFVMNNYWTTNYRHDQEGPVVFRYALMPHRRFDAAAAARFGIEQSQPLIAVPVDETAPLHRPLLQVDPAGVLVTALKPAADGNGWIVRLFGAPGQPETVSITWGDGSAPDMWRSNLCEEPLERVDGPFEVLPFEMVTLRIGRA